MLINLTRTLRIAGAMAVVSLLSIGQGAQTAITEQISAIGTNLVFIQPAPASNSLILEDATALRDAIDGLTYVVPQYIAGAQMKNENGSVQGRVVGSTPDYFLANNLTVDVGRPYDENEYDNAARVLATDYSGDTRPADGVPPLPPRGR